MLVPFFKRLEEDHDIHSLGPINRWVAGQNQKRKGKRRARHLIVLARNQTGLRNLYKLVSKAHLELGRCDGATSALCLPPGISLCGFA